MVLIAKKEKPTAINRRGNKIEYNGYVFDSTKEYKFFKQYIENCGYKYGIHPQFTLYQKFGIKHVNFRGITYKPDFVIYNEDGTIKHVYDVKNGFSVYDIDTGVNLRFKLFAHQFNVPVEVVTVRKDYFKLKILGTTKRFDIKQLKSVDYDWIDLCN